MSAITDEIVAIETEINKCFDTDSPIDPKNLVRLYDLRVERAKELAAHHKALLSDRKNRIELMKMKTRELTAKTYGCGLELKPDLRDRILQEMDKFDAAALLWIDDDSGWEQSQSFSIAAGILILVNEIH